MAFSPRDLDEPLAECPECGKSAMDAGTPCSRCQEPGGDHPEDRCQNCGEPVSESFRRVLGDNDNVAHACQECTPRTEHYHGAVAGETHGTTPVVQR